MSHFIQIVRTKRSKSNNREGSNENADVSYQNSYKERDYEQKTSSMAGSRIDDSKRNFGGGYWQRAISSMK